MTPGIHCCRDDGDLGKAIRHMEALKVRRLPVINKSKRMVGILSLGDLSHSACGDCCPNGDAATKPVNLESVCSIWHYSRIERASARRAALADQLLPGVHAGAELTPKIARLGAPGIGERTAW